jgi:hypothetical protein
MADPDDPAVALVRPYALTQGRTRARLDIALEALVTTTPRGHRPAPGPHPAEHDRIARLCDRRVQSLAEIAARLRLPIAVARVLVADMAADRLVEVFAPVSLDDDRQALWTLDRVLRGLRRM